MEDFLIVTYDNNAPKDMPVLVVSQKRGRFFDMKKCFVGDKAEQVYNLLTKAEQEEHSP